MSLPGVHTTIIDNFSNLARTNIPDGPWVAILGRRTTASGTADGTDTNAVEVADLDVYVARKESRIVTAFGEGSDLHRGFLEALSGGAQRIYLIPLPSDTAYNHTLGTISSSSYTDGDLWDDAWVAVEASQADVVVPWGRGSGPTEWQSPATPGDDAEFGFYANNSTNATRNWAAQVAIKAADIVARSNPIIAVMGLKPYIGASGSTGGMTPAQVATHLAFSGLVDRDSTVEITDNDLSMTDVGMYVNIVAAELTPTSYDIDDSYGYSNGAALYAGWLIQSNSWSAPTGKIIPNVSAIRYNPTRTQQQSIIDLGLVPVALNYSRIPTWVDAQTYAVDTSQYTRLTTVRIVFDAVQTIRQLTQPFVGEASTMETRNALETAVSRGLIGMQQAGALLSSDFTITYDPENNRAIIDLSLRPAFELRTIEISVTVQI